MNQIPTPPHSLEAERAVLGNVLAPDTGEARARNLDRLTERLRPDDFLPDAHRTIYARMRALREAHGGVDLITLHDGLREAGELERVGGPAALAQLAEDGCISALLDEYIRIVLRDAGRREAIQHCTAAITEAFGAGADPVALIASVTDRLTKVSERLEPSPEGRAPGPRSLAVVLDEYARSLEAPETDFVTFPVPEVNQRLGGGSLRGDVITLGGRPGVAKTALALQVAAHNAQWHGHRVLVISREMTAMALGRRFIAQDGQIDAGALRRRDLDPFDEVRVRRSITRLASLPIWLDDTTSTIGGIRRLVRAGDYRLVIVDYLQLLDPPSDAQGNRRLEVSAISRAMKKMAKRERVTVLQLSSLTRLTTEKGQKTRPDADKLKESGDIEHDSDVVLLLHWPDHEQSERELIFAKAREGETGGMPVILEYIPRWVRFNVPDETSSTNGSRSQRQRGEEVPF